MLDEPRVAAVRLPYSLTLDTRNLTRSRRCNVIPRSLATTEVYYVLEGTGRMELNGKWFDVRPGSVIQIDAGTLHRLVADDEVTTLVMAMPAFNPADEHFDSPSSSVASSAAT